MEWNKNNINYTLRIAYMFPIVVINCSNRTLITVTFICPFLLYINFDYLKSATHEV
jgi:hypothetical protein